MRESEPAAISPTVESSIAGVVPATEIELKASPAIASEYSQSKEDLKEDPDGALPSDWKFVCVVAGMFVIGAALALVFFVLGGNESAAGGLLPPVPNRTGNTTAPTDFDDGPAPVPVPVCGVGFVCPVIHPDPVRVQLTIYQSFDDVGLQGSSQRFSYNTTLVTTIAGALGIDPSLLKVQEVLPGSGVVHPVIVNFDILTNKTATAECAARKLFWKS